jgi:hypothetical protein
LFIAGLAVITVAAISFTGCELTENGSKTDVSQTNEAKIAAAKNELTIPAETDRDLDLPTVLNGVALSWASSDEAVISGTGLVTRRPFYDAEATLTATLTLGNASDTKEFPVTVIPIVFEEAEAELVEVNFYHQPGMTYQLQYIMMTYPDENVFFNCSADNGLLSVNSRNTIDLAKNASVPSGKYIWWHDLEIGEDGKYFQSLDYGSAFIEIVLRVGENIIGYAVVEPYWVQSDGFHANLLKSVLFPQVDGEYQNVSEEYVNAAIEKIKAEYKGEDSL